jgi:hypothetical protein
MGFTVSGIQAGICNVVESSKCSLFLCSQATWSAAATLSRIGNMVAGSGMAIGQSAGAGGNGLVIVNGAAQLVR